VKSPGTTEQGFAAIAAVFLVVVLAALGAFMVTLSNTQHTTSAQDVLGSRAYWAAEAGLEWGLVKAPLDANLCPNAVATQMAPTGATPVVLTSVEGFTVELLCAKNSYTEGATSLTIYRIEARAHSAAPVAPGSLGYVERSLSASMER
jgi:MSHA biogenesis protein MshP